MIIKYLTYIHVTAVDYVANLPLNIHDLLKHSHLRYMVRGGSTPTNWHHSSSVPFILSSMSLIFVVVLGP